MMSIQALQQTAGACRVVWSQPARRWWC